MTAGQRQGAITARGGRAALAIGGFAALTGCIVAGAEPVRPACVETTDCASGEECEDGVCWGNPPTGEFGAVMSPGPGDPGARTEIAPLYFSSNGWMTGKTEGPPQVVLASTVRIRGQVTTPCPIGLVDCSGTIAVPARLRFGRTSAVSASRVAFETTTTDGEYQIVLPRPTERATYVVTIAPSDVALGQGLPSPAELIPPRRIEVPLEPTIGDDGQISLFLADPGNQRLIAGALTRPPPANLIGWRVHAEAASADDPGLLERVSNFGRVDASGNYKLWIPTNRGPIDLVVTAPAAGVGQGPAPGLRRRGLVLDQAMTLPALVVPAPGRSTQILVEVTGTDSGGDHDVIDGATVVARMDQEVAPGLYLTHRAFAPTNERGVVALPLWEGAGGVRHRYAVDVLPGAGSEQAAMFGDELVVDATTSTTVTIDLDRRATLRGAVVDDRGRPLDGATVTARLSAETRCDLSSGERSLTRSLPLPTATTDPDGRYVLWVDAELDARQLRYDILVEPQAGTAPSGTLAEQAPGDELPALVLPPAAYVRGQVLRPDGSAAARTLVQIYEQVERVVSCGANTGGTPTPTAILRAVGTTDDAGWVGLVLPRSPVPTLRDPQRP